MSETATVGPVAPANLDALKRVKEAEQLAEFRRNQVRSDAATALKAIADETEAELLRAQQEAQSLTTSVLTAARASADAEAKILLAEGKKSAQAREVQASQSVAARRDEVLRTVLGAFLPE
jgi:vacuolar-type H+-ATPase subunit H